MRIDGALGNGAIQLLVEEGKVRVGERYIDLTPMESNLLALLLENANRLLSRDELLKQVWGESYQGSARTIDTHIGRLRGKLGRFGRTIQTVRGVGYRLVVR